MVKTITVQATIAAPIAKVWDLYTQPEHVKQWNNASEDWHTPTARNELRVGGKFLYRMEARDKSAGFDFEGTYTDVRRHALIAYKMSDDRKVETTFTTNDQTIGENTGENTIVIVTFDPEEENSLEMQQQGWQAILDNFKKYAETRK